MSFFYFPFYLYLYLLWYDEWYFFLAGRMSKRRSLIRSKQSRSTGQQCEPKTGESGCSLSSSIYMAIKQPHHGQINSTNHLLLGAKTWLREEVEEGSTTTYQMVIMCPVRGRHRLCRRHCVELVAVELTPEKKTKRKRTKKLIKNWLLVFSWQNIDSTTTVTSQCGCDTIEECGRTFLLAVHQQPTSHELSRRVG